MLINPFLCRLLRTASQYHPSIIEATHKRTVLCCMELAHSCQTSMGVSPH